MSRVRLEKGLNLCVGVTLWRGGGFGAAGASKLGVTAGPSEAASGFFLINSVFRLGTTLNGLE